MNTVFSPRIVLVEPSWTREVHLPANLGMLRIVKEAYPSAKATYVGGAEQIELMKATAPPDAIAGVEFVAWGTSLDKDTLPGDVFRAYLRLKALPAGLLANADQIVLTSCTATILSALAFIGYAGKSCAVLHGNANELGGWRSKNPVRSFFDFTASLKRFCRQGGKVIVMEKRIQQKLVQSTPWLATHLECIPHPLLPEESSPPDQVRALSRPIRIGLVGTATLAKGFPQFLEFAGKLQRNRPGMFEFHAIGNLPGESKAFDQSHLTTRAEKPLSRNDYITALRKLNYMFVWPSDLYYENAASGVVYDALNLALPLIARRSTQILEWQEGANDIGYTFDSLDDAVKLFEGMDLTLEAKRYAYQQQSLQNLRASFSINLLGQLFRSRFHLDRNLNNPNVAHLNA